MKRSNQLGIDSSDLIDHFRIDAHCYDEYTLIYLPVHGHRNKKREERWLRKKPLGQGSFGIVWLEEQKDGERCAARAVKEVKKSLGFGQSFKLDYARELFAMAKLSKHLDQFVEFHGWYETEQNVYLSMEYFPHRDLGHCTSGPLPEVEAQDIISQTLEGLKILHEYGITHRDLKPQNIFVVQKSPNWWVKIGDFGISKRTDDFLTHLHTEIGTAAYMAPEILDEESFEYTNAVDIWALGCVLYLLLAWMVPFPNKRALKRYVTTPDDFPIQALLEKSITPSALAFLQALLSVIPESRPTAKAALGLPWLVIDKGDARPSSHRNSVSLSGGASATVISANLPTASSAGESSVSPENLEHLPLRQTQHSSPPQFTLGSLGSLNEALPDKEEVISMERYAGVPLQRDLARPITTQANHRRLAGLGTTYPESNSNPDRELKTPQASRTEFPSGRQSEISDDSQEQVDPMPKEGDGVGNGRPPPPVEHKVTSLPLYDGQTIDSDASDRQGFVQDMETINAFSQQLHSKAALWHADTPNDETTIKRPLTSDGVALNSRSVALYAERVISEARTIPASDDVALNSRSITLHAERVMSEALATRASDVAGAKLYQPFIEDASAAAESSERAPTAPATVQLEQKNKDRPVRKPQTWIWKTAVSKEVLEEKSYQFREEETRVCVAAELTVGEIAVLTNRSFRLCPNNGKWWLERPVAKSDPGNPIQASQPKLYEKRISVTLEELFNGNLRKFKIGGKPLKVKIEPGMIAGNKIMFDGLGNQEIDGWQDFHFILEEKVHPRFRREGLNLVATADLHVDRGSTTWRTVVTSIDGKKINLSGDGDRPSRSEERFPELGMPLREDPSVRGELIVQFKLHFSRPIPEYMREGEILKALPANTSEEICVALWKFRGQKASDLSFEEGDVIMVTDRCGSAGGWWHGRIGPRTGQFPRHAHKLQRSGSVC